MADFVNLDGQLLPYEEAGVAAMDAGMMHGAGLFETMRARKGRVFRMRSHLERLMTSARLMGMVVDLSPGHLAEMVLELVEANGLSEGDARVRLTVTRGDLHAATVGNPMPPVALLLTASAFGAYPAIFYEKGMSVVVSKFKQNPESPVTGHKVTSYFDRLLGLREAQELGCGEAIWFTAGGNFLAEGCVSNVFLVDMGGNVMTPPVSIEGRVNERLCLPGVTRGVVMEVAEKMGRKVREKMMTIHELLGAREVFLTNSVMGVMPVGMIEKHAVGKGGVGEVTGKLREAYDGVLREEMGEV